jgi:hypothetical protein
VHGRDLAFGGPVQVEEELVDLGEMLDASGQSLTGLLGLFDDVAAEAPRHTDEDEFDGELDTRVGIAVVRGEEHTREDDGQAGDDRQPRHHAQTTGEPGDDRGDTQGDEEG